MSPPPPDAPGAKQDDTVLAEPLVAGLVARARAGDRGAFAALHERFASMVHGVLVARAGAQEADDLAQEVFLAAWRGLSGLRDTDHVGAWLAGIARNRAARHFDRRKPPTEMLNDEPIDVRADGGAHRKLENEEVLSVLRTLPETYAETLALRLIEGLTGPEIAAATGLTPGSVRVNLSRGMALLKERLARAGWP